MSVVMAGVAEVLKEARRLLPDEQHWTQGGSGVKVLPNGTRACCLGVAVEWASKRLGPTAWFTAFERNRVASRHLRNAIRKRTRRDVEGIPEYNDAPSRTYKQIIGVLDAAIVAAEKEEANVRNK